MTNYFNKAITEYRKVINGKLINPISNKDALIIELILERLKQLGEKELFTYLKSNWKFLKDEDILEEVQKIISEIDDVEDEKESREDIKTPPTEYIEFESLVIEVSYIRSWEKETDYLEDEYLIVLNKVPLDVTKISPYSNLIFTYSDIEERDEKYSLLKEKLKHLKNININEIDGKVKDSE